MIRLMMVLILFGLVMFAPSTRAADTRMQEQQAQPLATRLVEQLGHPLWRQRESAADELIRLGRLAKDALINGQTSADPEIRHRCSVLLPQALQADRRARVERFLADPKSISAAEVPGLAIFRKDIGEDASARDLYVEMLRKHDQLLEALDGDASKLNDVYIQRSQQLYNSVFGNFQGGVRPTVDAIDLTALIFIGANLDANQSAVNRNMSAHSYLINLMFQPSFQNAIKSPTNKAMRKVLYRWLEQRSDSNAMQQGMSLIVQCELKEMLPLAVKVIETKTQPQYVRAMAMLVVGKFGTTAEIPMLQKYFDDEALLGQFQINNVMGVTQVRDVALAMAIHLSGQTPKDYGFEMLANQPLNFTYFYNLGFSSKENREAAQKKWKASQMKSPK